MYHDEVANFTYKSSSSTLPIVYFPAGEKHIGTHRCITHRQYFTFFCARATVASRRQGGGGVSPADLVGAIWGGIYKRFRSAQPSSKQTGARPSKRSFGAVAAAHSSAHCDATVGLGVNSFRSQPRKRQGSGSTAQSVAAKWRGGGGSRQG